MALQEIRPGVYVRTDAPKKVRITEEFADAVRQEGKSAFLEQILERLVREDAERADSSRP